MNPNKEKKLVRIPDEYDIKGVKFVRAKKELLAKGYTESEIVYALYSAPFNGETTAPRPPNPLNKFYSDNPDKADKLAKTLLLNDMLMDSDKSIAYTGAAGAGIDTQSRLYYDVLAADKLGIPYYTLFFLGITISIVVAIAVVKFDLSDRTSDLIVSLYSLSIGLLFGYKILMHRLAIRKLRKQTREDTDQKGAK